MSSVCRAAAARSAASSSKPEHVLSIHHVLERNADVSVVSAEGSFKGEVVGRDRRSDLALVRVPGLPAPALPSHASAKVGALNLVVARSVRGNLEVSQGVVAFNSGVAGDGTRTVQARGSGAFHGAGLLRHQWRTDGERQG
ncbi:MAG: trypsin-like peptidase domain-containing protein [Pleurocapsa sp. SU_196_0]|nr:trypsin-like peptidase domain-containing protein [Pleurocapsa sp. SU_196_0]